MTYAELGERLGCSPNAARMHALRRGWQRRASNRIGQPARVLVPQGADVRESATHDVAPFAARANGGEPPAHDVEQTIAALSAHLDREQARADRAEHLFDQEHTRGDRLEQLFHGERDRADRYEQQIDQLQTALADAIGAERIAAGEAAALRGQLKRLRDTRLWRRLTWAIRPRRSPP
jgi:hypothetical protein